MMTSQIRIEEISSFAMNEGKRLGCSDVSVIASDSDNSQVRFSNNTITLVSNVRNIVLEVYLAKDRKRIVGATYNPSEGGVRKFLQNLLAACEALPPSEEYAPLPSGPFKYEDGANFDSKVIDAPLVDYVKQAVDSALQQGANRVSGSLNTESSHSWIMTSAGCTGEDSRTEMLLNVRAFAEDNASGHGLSCTSYVSDFDPTKAGNVAGEYAKRSLNPKSVGEGKYNIIFSPTVVANILPIAQHASAFSIEAGVSFLADQLGKKVGVDYLSVEDYGVLDHGLGGRIFDDEGIPTQKTSIVEDGIFQNMLHNSTTAKKFGSKSTGNAGIITPSPTTILFGPGNVSFDEMVKETHTGIFVTNNWYTRYQNWRTGDYSTVPRDAAFRIEDGEMGEPVAGLRLSDSVLRQLVNIESISKERRWIKWWEVATPTFAPVMMIKDVQVTKAVGS